MRFDLFSFLLGVIAATWMAVAWQGVLNRRRWRNLSTSLKHYAKSLERAK
jgi:hypothetical protein